ncbi:unnamed protein product, partial [Mesorhabditis spiculigera]
MDDPLSEDILCEYCLRFFPEDQPIIECAECAQPLYFCKTCFAYGVEAGEHQRGHNYKVHRRKTRQIVKVDRRLGFWGHEEDMKLVASTRLTKAANWAFLANQINFTGPQEALADHFDKYFIRGQIGQFARDFVELMRVLRVEGSRWWREVEFLGDSLKLQVIVRAWMDTIEEMDPNNVDAVVRATYEYMQRARLTYESVKIDGKKRPYFAHSPSRRQSMILDAPVLTKEVTVKEELAVDVSHECSDDSETLSPRRSSRKIKKTSRILGRDRKRLSFNEEDDSPLRETPPRRAKAIEDDTRRRRASGVSNSSCQMSPQIVHDDDFPFVKPQMREKRSEDVQIALKGIKEEPNDCSYTIPCECPANFSSPQTFCVRCGWCPAEGPHPYEPLWYIVERNDVCYVINTDDKLKAVRCKFRKEDSNPDQVLIDSFVKFPRPMFKPLSRQTSVTNPEKKKKDKKEEKSKNMMWWAKKDAKAAELSLKIKPLKLIRRFDGSSTSLEPSPEDGVNEEELKPVPKLRLKKGASVKLDQSVGRKMKVQERKRATEESEDEEEEREVEANEASEPPALELMSPSGANDDESFQDYDEDDRPCKRKRKMSRKMRESIYGEDDDETPLSSPIAKSSPNKAEIDQDQDGELQKFFDENVEADDPYAHLLDNVGPGWESNASDGEDIVVIGEQKPAPIFGSGQRLRDRRDSTNALKRVTQSIESRELNGDYWKPVATSREERARRNNRTLSPQSAYKRRDSFDDTDLGVIPELEKDRLNDSLASEDDSEQDEEEAAQIRRKIPFRYMLDEELPYKMEEEMPPKKRMHILKSASGIRPHWSSSVITSAFGKMALDDSSRNSVKNVLKAVDQMHRWRSTLGEEPKDVLDDLTRPAPFPGRQVFSNLLSDHQRAGQVLSGIPISYYIQDIEEEDLNTSCYEDGDSDGGLSELVTKSVWCDSLKMPKGSIGIAHKYGPDGQVKEEFLYPGDQEGDVVVNKVEPSSPDKMRKLKMKQSEVCVIGLQTHQNPNVIVWNVEQPEVAVQAANSSFGEGRKKLISNLLNFGDDATGKDVLFRYLSTSKPKVPQTVLEYKTVLDKKSNSIQFKFDSGLRASSKLYEPSTSTQKADETILESRKLGFITPKKKLKVSNRAVLSDDSDADSPPSKYRKPSSTKKVATARAVEEKIVSQGFNKKDPRRRVKHESSCVDEETDGMKTPKQEIESATESSGDESEKPTPSAKKTQQKKKRKKALTKTERRLHQIKKKRENLLKQSEAERDRIYEVVGYGRNLSELAAGGLPRLARIPFIEPGKEACKGKNDEMDMLAYYPGRVDYELELQNEMEEVMSRTLFKDYPGTEHDPVLDMENEIKLIRSERFNRVLAERLAANRAIFQYNKNKEYMDFLKKVNEGRKKPSEIVAEKSGDEALLCTTQQVLKPEEIDTLVEKRQRAIEAIAKVKALQALQKQGILEYDKDAREQVERAVEVVKPKIKKRKHRPNKAISQKNNKYRRSVKWNKMREFYKT